MESRCIVKTGKRKICGTSCKGTAVDGKLFSGAQISYPPVFITDTDLVLFNGGHLNT